MKFKVGDKIKRIYTYEIKENLQGKLYAHILDGSDYHLKIESVQSGFRKIN